MHRRSARLRTWRERSHRGGDLHEHPDATDDLSAVADADAVFLGVKAYSLPELAPRLAPHLAPGAAVTPTQNGIPWWFFQSFDGPLRRGCARTSAHDRLRGRGTRQGRMGAGSDVNPRL
ncbi:MAG: ketopantoate reductase family protein [Gaiellaceae bacterium]